MQTGIAAPRGCDDACYGTSSIVFAIYCSTTGLRC
jgi:hypothetical protein